MTRQRNRGGEGCVESAWRRHVLLGCFGLEDLILRCCWFLCELIASTYPWITYTTCNIYIYMICREPCHGRHLYAILRICYFHLLLSLPDVWSLESSAPGQGQPQKSKPSLALRWRWARTKGTCLNRLEKSIWEGGEVEYLDGFLYDMSIAFFLPTSFACWTWRKEKNNYQHSRSQNGWGSFQDKTRIPNSYDRCMFPLIISIQHIRKYLVIFGYVSIVPTTGPKIVIRDGVISLHLFATQLCAAASRIIKQKYNIHELSESYLMISHVHQPGHA